MVKSCRLAKRSRRICSAWSHPGKTAFGLGPHLSEVAGDESQDGQVMKAAQASACDAGAV